MDPLVKSECAAALGRLPAEVERLHEEAQLLPALLARQILLLSSRLQPARQAAQVGPDFCAAVAASFGAGREFTASDLVDFASEAPTVRGDLMCAIQALAGCQGTPTARRLGMALADLQPLVMEWFRIGSRDVRGTKHWVVQDLRE